MDGTVAMRLRWGMLLLATAAAGGCGRQAAVDRGAVIRRAIRSCDMSSGQSSLIPVEVVAVEPQGAEWAVDLVGLWADRQPVELVLTSTVPGATAQPTSLPNYIGRCHVLVKEHGGRVQSDDGFNVLTRPWVGPTLTAAASRRTQPTSTTADLFMTPTTTGLSQDLVPTLTAPELFEQARLGCVGFRIGPSLVAEQVITSSQGSWGWSVTLSGLWSFHPPMVGPPAGIPFPTQPVSYVRLCTTSSDQTSSWESTTNILTEPALAPTLTAGVATSYALSAKWRAEATASLRAAWTAEAGRRSEQRYR